MTAYPESGGGGGRDGGSGNGGGSGGSGGAAGGAGEGGGGRRRRPVVFQEAVEPAPVDGILPVTLLAVIAAVAAVVSTVAATSFRHTDLWWLPGGAWAAVVIGVYGNWHVRRHRDRVRAREAPTAPRD